jgi:phospholipase/carboxylesterase
MAVRTTLLGLLVAAGAGCQGHVQFVEREELVEGTRFVQRFLVGADGNAPLIVGIHGRGGRPEAFGDEMFGDLREKVELALPQAPKRRWFGWTWFDDWKDDESFTRSVDLAEQQLWPGIAAIAHGRKVFVVGVSQGGILAFLLALRHPEQVAYAFPISGFALRDFLPRQGASVAPVYAVHGTVDRTVPIALDEASVKALREVGAIADLREFPGVGHEITVAMREDVLAHLRAALHAANVR